MKLLRGSAAFTRAVSGYVFNGKPQTPKAYVRELKRISNYRYYSLRVRAWAQEILDRILCK